MDILDRIKKLCKLKGITLSRMEKDIGLSQGAAYKWKNSSPSLEVLEKLSYFFNVSVDYIMSGNEKEKPEIPTFEPEHLELIELYSKLNKEQKAAIINMLRTFAL